MEKNDKDSDETEKKPKEKFVVRSATDVQRIKLQKLMDNPTKEVNIPVPRTKKFDEFGNASTPSFVRNVMGSSAGAGSGEFHVYRHLRRKEYARQKNIQQMSKQEQLDEDFKNRLERNRIEAEQKTAKKRAKRLKKKKNVKNRKLNPKQPSTHEEPDESSEESENDNDDAKEDKDNEIAEDTVDTKDKISNDEKSQEAVNESEDNDVVESSDVPAQEQPQSAESN